MHVQPVLAHVAQGPQSGDARLSGIVQFRAVLHAQDHRMGAHPLKAAFPVWRQHRLPIHVFVRQQPIRRLGLRPAPTGHRNAGAGLRPQPFHHSHQPSVQPRVPQLRSTQLRPTQLRRRPTHRRRLRHPLLHHHLYQLHQMGSAAPGIKICVMDSLQGTFHCQLQQLRAQGRNVLLAFDVLGQLAGSPH